MVLNGGQRFWCEKQRFVEMQWVGKVRKEERIVISSLNTISTYFSFKSDHTFAMGNMSQLLMNIDRSSCPQD